MVTKKSLETFASFLSTRKVGDVYSSSEAGRETGLSGDTIRNVILEINKNGKSIDEIGKTTKKRYKIVRKIKMPNCS